MANTKSVFEDMMKSVVKSQQKQNSENNDKYEYSSVESYLNQDNINTMDLSHYFFPLFFASEKGPLGIWEKQIGLGHIKRRIDMDGGQRYHVLELVNVRQNLGTYISVPKAEWMALHLALPHLVMVVKNLRRNFSFEVQVLDHRGFLRRFDIATWYNPSNLRKWPFLCQLPLKLEMGWNEIHLDFNDLLLRTYKTRHFETVRLVVNANCRVRQIFFCADNVINGEVPIPSMRIFENIKTVSLTFGALNHPNYTEVGPNNSREVPLPDPANIPPPTRVEKDLRLIHIERFNELNKLELREPYRSHFKELLMKSKAIVKMEEQAQQRLTKTQEQHNKDNPPEEELSTSTSVKSLVASSVQLVNQELFSVPFPTGFTGPISLVQLMKRSPQYLPPRSYAYYSTISQMSDKISAPATSSRVVEIQEDNPSLILE